jgi:hypothetical protein
MKHEKTLEKRRRNGGERNKKKRVSYMYVLFMII